ncbi:uncharacterized protein LACBIDRAFT_332771 [Laccaria bicolor S238N-H82]|uniref:Predicted protein n=1 Tax=Laccaria bicolor (strain S238N-H82 / ATCC MYA-4686) TaxID=486041 RepID=B0DU10_LACBS|nr:uncharacterized protein LACBIDRAFT_332771 [Laccaria bicolor S238N-H82]EDR02004.1 predicted protein [Laccaria bicolor S238N-H82]|eukprot:XP_001887395.1 predicted protein [Laccaria bicolor S238N-H82]
MQAVELYNPNTPNLHLILFASTYSLSEDVNPLNYQLTADDFIVLTQADGQLFYALDPSTTTSLFWALHRLAHYIMKAASHKLHNDPSILFASEGYIPQFYFDRINMCQPDILTIQDQVFLNPLCRYTTRENLSAWYCDFQTIGRLTVQWIQTAQCQTLQLGAGTGWNWEACQGLRLEYPECHLITTGNAEEGGNDSFADDASEWSTEGLDGWSDGELMSEMGEGEGKEMVLHPFESTYAAHYPGFDTFIKQPLIYNG